MDYNYDYNNNYDNDLSFIEDIYTNDNFLWRRFSELIDDEEIITND